MVDNEVKTLLQCVKSCKTRKTYDARINWNSIKEKYDNIRAVHLFHFPNEKI